MAKPTLDDVTPALRRALDHLSDTTTPIGVRALGRELGVGPARASQLVARLVDLGWALRRERGVEVTSLGLRVSVAYEDAAVRFAQGVGV